MRIIPARAGFTRSRPVTVSPTAGSSPLARGLRIHYSARGARDRIIPARAGFTWSNPRNQTDRGGSSPLARGLLYDNFFLHHWSRIIPARAGFTFMILDFIHSAAGSSPLARGLLRRYLRRRINRRIIPARAGFTPAWRRACPAHPDHPRSRGVYQFALRATINILDHPRSRGVYRSKRLHHHLGHGSSPLARGLRHPRPHTGGGGRIIPARAGFTPPSEWRP